MSEEFTKGPWESENRTVYKLSPCNIGGIGGMANHFYLSVQRGHKDGASQPELEANAHLIAASPIMYQKLKDLLDVLPDGEWSNTKSEIREILCGARGEHD